MSCAAIVIGSLRVNSQNSYLLVFSEKGSDAKCEFYPSATICISHQSQFSIKEKNIIHRSGSLLNSLVCILRLAGTLN